MKADANQKVIGGLEVLNLAEEEERVNTQPMKLKAIPMEILGTFALVYFGGLTLILFDLGELSMTGVALAHGLIYSVMVWMGDKLSGGYYNPALTLGDMAVQKISFLKGLYIICA